MLIRKTALRRTVNRLDADIPPSAVRPKKAAFDFPYAAYLDQIFHTSLIRDDQAASYIPKLDSSVLHTSLPSIL